MQTLSPSHVQSLASELNHLLWTPDTPMLSDEFAKGLMHRQVGNMQCAAHALICAALMLRHGDSVATRGGCAFAVYPDANNHVCMDLIAKHWWITTSKGACDLSIRLTHSATLRPLIFENQNLNEPNWKIGYKSDFEATQREASKWAREGRFGLFYCTEAKNEITLSDLEWDLDQVFPPASKVGIALRYSDIVRHCEELLATGQGLYQYPQSESWRLLAESD